MADDYTANAGSGGDSFGADEISSVKYPRIKLIHGADGVNAGDVATGNPLPVVQTGTHTVTGPVTDAQLRATPVPVSGTVTANAGTGTLAVSAAALPLPSGASTAAKQPALGTAGSASTDVITVQGIASGTAQPVSGPLTDAQLRATAVPVSGAGAGDTAHDAVDAGNPVKVGHKAIAHGTNPTAVAAADRTDSYANRAGVPFVIGGHPNTRCATYIRTDAATDDNVLVAISTGLKYVVTRVTITLDEATTVGVAVRLGFGATVVPALGTTGADGVEGILLSHPGLVPGSGITMGDGSGILGVGGDGEELRITSEVPTSGALHVSVSFYTIES